jgi:hypothetical protein
MQDADSYSKLLSVLTDLHAISPGTPPIVVTDFEQGLMKAVKEFLPWAEVIFSLFPHQTLSFPCQLGSNWWQ